MVDICKHEQVETCTYDSVDWKAPGPVEKRTTAHLWFRCVNCGAELAEFSPMRDHAKLVNVVKPGNRPTAEPRRELARRHELTT